MITSSTLSLGISFFLYLKFKRNTILEEKLLKSTKLRNFRKKYVGELVVDFAHAKIQNDICILAFM